MLIGIIAGGPVDIPSIMYWRIQKRLDRFNNELPSTLKRFRNDHPNEWRGVKLVPPDITFDKKLTIEMGDFSLELYHFKGHTADSIIGFHP